MIEWIYIDRFSRVHAALGIKEIDRILSDLWDNGRLNAYTIQFGKAAYDQTVAQILDTADPWAHNCFDPRPFEFNQYPNKFVTLGDHLEITFIPVEVVYDEEFFCRIGIERANQLQQEGAIPT